MQFAPGAYRRAAVPAVLAAPLLVVSRVGAGLALLAAVAVLAFYRDPDRSPAGAGVVSPADGRVSVIREEAPDGSEGDADERLRVGVFMNVHDVHVNRAPIGGTVERVEHDPGGHWPAFTKASERNERLTVVFEDHEVVLIAGTVARRTRSYVAAGDDLGRGERLGHIAFGSRADVLLPPEFDREDLRVERGETVRAGETVLASP